MANFAKDCVTNITFYVSGPSCGLSFGTEFPNYIPGE
jgi:hypothetical protein